MTSHSAEKPGGGIYARKTKSQKASSVFIKSNNKVHNSEKNTKKNADSLVTYLIY